MAKTSLAPKPRTEKPRVMAVKGKRSKTPRRERYLNKLCEEGRSGDVGAHAEFIVAMVRDRVAIGQWVPLNWCDDALASIRKLRRLVGSTKKQEAA